jgi:hypothetical protein
MSTALAIGLGIAIGAALTLAIIVALGMMPFLWWPHR